MKNYYFNTREFGISDQGFHLLRSGFNYETIEFNQVVGVTIERGKELNNWPVILIIGLGLITFSTYYSLRLFNVIGTDEVSVIYMEEILVPLIPFMLGGYCIYSSTRNGTIIRIKTTKNKNDKFPLRELEKANKCKGFGSLSWEN